MAGNRGLFGWPKGDDGSAAIVKLDEVVVTALRPDIVFAGITPKFRHLQIVVVARSETAAVSDELAVNFNGDTAANYDYERLTGSGATAAAVEGLAASLIKAGYIAASTGTASNAGSAQLLIPDYARRGWKKALTSTGGYSGNEATGNTAAAVLHGKWRSTEPIAKIVFTTVSAANFSVGSIACLYGLR